MTKTTTKRDGAEMATNTTKTKKRNLPISVCDIVEAEDLGLERGWHDRLAATPEEKRAANIKAMFEVMGIKPADEHETTKGGAE